MQDGEFRMQTATDRDSGVNIVAILTSVAPSAIVYILPFAF
jgi:hypothetical protein